MQKTSLSGILPIGNNIRMPCSLFGSGHCDRRVLKDGVGAPGVALGDTRAQVEKACGAPKYCGDVTEDDLAFCTFCAAGGGRISVRYRGPEGGRAGNSPHDIVHTIRWFQGVTCTSPSGAVERAGPNTVNRECPYAGSLCDGFTGEIYRLVDAELNVSITRWYNFYTGRTTVQRVILPTVISR